MSARDDPGRIGTEPEVTQPRWYAAVFWGLIFAFSCLFGVLVWSVWTAPPTHRLTCPDGYALVSNFGSKAYCAPGLVEPVRR